MQSHCVEFKNVSVWICHKDVVEKFRNSDRGVHHGHPMCPYEQTCGAKILTGLASHQQVASRLLCLVDRFGALNRHLKKGDTLAL